MADRQNFRLKHVIQTLEDMKAKDLVQLNVSELTTIADHIIIASGTSNRHLKAMATEVIKQAKQAGEPPLGVEGQQEGDWVLVDLDNILVHIMLPEVRVHYDLERLWNITPSHREQDS